MKSQENSDHSYQPLIQLCHINKGITCYMLSMQDIMLLSHHNFDVCAKKVSIYMAALLLRKRWQ